MSKNTREQLLRVPGIGPIGVDVILRARRQGRLTELFHLRQLNICAPEQAAPYILLDGHRPVVQLSLFS
jgi:predicted DNA-binding helix-hairpin-helix protein